MRMFRRKDEGFTLVELMVVVLIIGILVAIAIPVFNAASRTARQRTCHSNQRTIEGAVQQYLAASPNNTIAQTDGVLGASGSGATATLLGANGYIKEAPACPEGDLQYTLASGNTTCPVSGVLAHGHY
ncbi:MAG: type II secretion system protein, partial [Coriobacteriales bacterium]|nr:type II secretion system GspH family protein [Actinomycetes bacterium]